MDETGKGGAAHAQNLFRGFLMKNLSGCLAKLKRKDPAATARLREARRMSEEMIHSGEFDPA